MSNNLIFTNDDISCEISGVTREWKLSCSTTSPEAGLHVFKWQLISDSERVLPEIKITFSVPQKDIQIMWSPGYGKIHHFFPPWWNGGKIPANLAQNAPVFSYMNLEGESRLTYAFSDTQRTSLTHTGPTESNGIINEISLFSVPEAPSKYVEFSLWIDRRNIHFSDALRFVSEWYETMPGYTPAEVPELAREPLYSTWYQYQQEVTAEKLERELEHIVALGIKTIILDDGWQLAEPYENDELYSHCGTWLPAENKFPDMRKHIEKFHANGIHYMIWFAVPFVGVHEKAYETFKGKFLGLGPVNTFILDPRFPEVREYTIQIYERAVKEWNVDGLKLDFIDSFSLIGKTDSALEDNYAGRDIKSLPVAVDKLLTDTMTRLKKLRGDILIEFRQKYIGPSIRKYGNIFRAADCPMDLLENRVRTIDLRLLSGDTAVHSDMLIWSPDDTPELAALQILNVIFSTPQISVVLETLPAGQRKMLEFWLKFCNIYRDTLLRGRLVPEHPELSYPIVTAFGKEEVISTVYESDRLVKTYSGKKNIIINAKHTGNMLLDMQKISSEVSIFNVFGKMITTRTCSNGLLNIKVPPSGYLELKS